jgi:hypothetical protein
MVDAVKACRVKELEEAALERFNAQTTNETEEAVEVFDVSERLEISEKDVSATEETSATESWREEINAFLASTSSCSKHAALSLVVGVFAGALAAVCILVRLVFSERIISMICESYFTLPSLEMHPLLQRQGQGRLSEGKHSVNNFSYHSQHCSFLGV